MPLTETVADGDAIASGGLELQAIEIPGHCRDQLAWLAGGTDVLTADCLFKGTVGGTGGGGETGSTDHKRSIMERLMKLPPETRVHPGHTLSTTIGDEWESNPFIRIWRGARPRGQRPLPRPRRGGDARPLGAGLRRHEQGLGAVRRRSRRDRRRLAGRALSRA